MGALGSLSTLQTAFHLAHGADFRCRVSGRKLSAVSYQPSAFRSQPSARLSKISPTSISSGSSFPRKRESIGLSAGNKLKAES